MRMKTMLIFVGVALVISVMLVVISLCIYQVKSQPRLIQICQLKDAILKCPEVSVWIKTRCPWEDLPGELLSKILSVRLSDEIVFATYEIKITAFRPYSFHATKGEFETSKGQEGHFYIYAWDKRYQSMIAP